MLVAIGVFRECGAMDLLVDGVRYFFSAFGIYRICRCFTHCVYAAIKRKRRQGHDG